MDFILLKNLLIGFTGFSRFVVDPFLEENGQTQLPSAKPITTASLTLKSIIAFLISLIQFCITEKNIGIDLHTYTKFFRTLNHD